MFRFIVFGFVHVQAHGYWRLPVMRCWPSGRLETRRHCDSIFCIFHQALQRHSLMGVVRLLYVEKTV